MMRVRILGFDGRAVLKNKLEILLLLSLANNLIFVTCGNVDVTLVRTIVG